MYEKKNTVAQEIWSLSPVGHRLQQDLRRDIETACRQLNGNDLYEWIKDCAISIFDLSLRRQLLT